MQLRVCAYGQKETECVGGAGHEIMHDILLTIVQITY